MRRKQSPTAFRPFTQARAWAEQSGLVAAGAQGPRYGSFATREEIVQMLWRLSQQK